MVTPFVQNFSNFYGVGIKYRIMNNINKFDPTVHILITQLDYLIIHNILLNLLINFKLLTCLNFQQNYLEITSLTFDMFKFLSIVMKD